MAAGIKIYIDGSCQPTNPGGYACWAYLVKDATGKVFDHQFGCLGHGAGKTNNVAEYEALAMAVQWLMRNNKYGVEIFSDSQLVVNQVNFVWGCIDHTLIRYLKRLSPNLATMKAQVRWIPRELNKEADALTRRAYNEAKAKGPGGGGQVSGVRDQVSGEETPADIFGAVLREYVPAEERQGFEKRFQEAMAR